MRGIKSAGNLVAQVEGDIEDVGGVLKITTIRLRLLLKAKADDKQAIDRVFNAFADKCPAYQSVKGCIDCSWTLEIQEPTED